MQATKINVDPITRFPEERTEDIIAYEKALSEGDDISKRIHIANEWHRLGEAAATKREDLASVRETARNQICRLLEAGYQPRYTSVEDIAAEASRVGEWLRAHEAEYRTYCTAQSKAAVDEAVNRDLHYDEDGLL